VSGRDARIRQAPARRAWASSALLAVVAASVVGCAPGVMEPAPSPLGPDLVVVIANHSASEFRSGYAFESGATSGSGEGSVLPCEVSYHPWGEVGGRLSVTVNEVEVFAQEVPADMPREGYLVLDVTVDERGAPRFEGEPRWTRATPRMDPVPVPGCG
jgi:hypothetical protein